MYRRISTSLVLTALSATVAHSAPISGTGFSADSSPGQRLNLTAGCRATLGVTAWANTPGSDSSDIRPYVGLLNQVAIYSKALTEDEIATHYQAGRPDRPLPIPRGVNCTASNHGHVAHSSNPITGGVQR